MRFFQQDKVAIDIRSLVAGAALCRGSHLVARAQGGHPNHLERASQALSFARRQAPDDVTIGMFAAQVALERADLVQARRILEPLCRGRAPKEAIALFAFLLEAEGDRERARVQYLRLRALGAREISEEALERLDKHPALYAPPSEELLAYGENASPEKPATQLAFLRASQSPALLKELVELALPYEPPAPMEVFALIDELRRRITRGNLARLVAAALFTAPEEEAVAVAEVMAKDPIEDRARAGGAALARRGYGARAAELLFANEALSMDTRAWALAFAPEAARPYLDRLWEGLSQEDIRFLRGAPALYGGLGEEGAEALLALLEAGQAQKAPEALGWLLATRDARGKTFLSQRFLARGEPELHRIALEEIGRIGGKEWLEDLTALVFEEPDPEAREEAALALYALAPYDPSPAVRALIKVAQEDPDTRIRELCAGLLTGRRFIRQRSVP